MDNKLPVLWPGWETVRLIGRGSFGAVYEIQREVFGHRESAALKLITIPQSDGDVEDLLNDGYDEQSITRRFEGYLQDIVREYSMMADMKGCANIVYCDDVKYVQHDGAIGWDILIKMELLNALPRALGRDIPETQVIKIGRDICGALSFCEKRHVLHRDIKPQNIFVAPDGTYKLGDFGVAKTAEKTTGGTRTGTYKYMAPEVYNNRPYGTRADIYSLGLVLYWLLNDRRAPFVPLPPAMPTASDEEKARDRRLSGEPIPAPAHGSEELRRIVLKACAYDPAERFRSADEMLSELEAISPGTARADDGEATISSANAAGQQTGRARIERVYTADGREYWVNDRSQGTEGRPSIDTLHTAAASGDETVSSAFARGTQQSRNYQSSAQHEDSCSTAFPQQGANYTAPEKQSEALRPEWSDRIQNTSFRPERNEVAPLYGPPPERDRRAAELKRKNRSGLIIGLAALGVVVLAAVLILVLTPKGGSSSSGGTGMTPQPAATAAPVVTPAPTPAPVVTAAPTPTPVPEHVHTWVPASFTQSAYCSGCGETTGSPNPSGVAPTVDELQYIIDNYGIKTGSDKGVKLELPGPGNYLDKPYRAVVRSAGGNGIYVMPKPKSGNGNLGGIADGTEVWIIAAKNDCLFFVADDGTMGWNGEAYFKAK